MFNLNYEFYVEKGWLEADIKTLLENCVNNIRKEYSNYMKDKNVFDIDYFTKDIYTKLPNKISENQLYYYIADYFANRIKNHYVFDAVSSYYAVCRIHKTTNENYSEVVHQLYNNKDKQNNDLHLVNKELFTVVMQHKHEIQQKLDYTRDYNLDFFAIRTLERSYLLRYYNNNKSQINIKAHENDTEAIILERPQHLFMRVALSLWNNDLEKVFETYDNLSNKYFTHATPTLFNAGSTHQQLSSCFDGKTLVNTLRGPIQIKEIEIGDEVITHLGNVKKVVQKHENDINNRKLYQVKIINTNNFTVTEDHNLYCYNTVSKTHEWKAVQNLTTNDYIMIPKYNNKYSYNIDNKFMKFLGMWYISGDIYKQNKIVQGINIKLKKNNTGMIDYCINMMNYFKQQYENVEIEIIKNKNSVEIIYKSSILGISFMKYIDQTTQKKILISDMYKYNTEHINNFISGLYTFNANIIYLKNKLLTDQIYSLCKIHNISIGSIKYTEIKNEKTYSIAKLTTDEYLENNNYNYLRFISRTEIVHDNTIKVYTLGVEDDHSYSIAGIIAQNCFLLGMSDNIDGIFNSISNVAHISKWAGGIGIHLSNIRSKGSLIRGTNGKSSGIIPLCVLLEKEARYINQGGKRNGSIAIYLEPWHGDILEFIELRQPNGDENMRTRDLFLALWVPDLFMKRVLENGMWSLMCPDQCQGLVDSYGDKFEQQYIKYENEGKYIKQIKALDLWNKIIECQIQSGMPYLLFKDHANNKSNQKNLGTIQSSNLCVSGNTNIITNTGFYEIKTCENKKVNIWNGYEFSEVEVKKTGYNQKLLDIDFSNGEKLACTEYHKFYIQNIDNTVKECRAYELKQGDKIIHFNMPILTDEFLDTTFSNPYYNGYYCAKNYYFNSKCDITYDLCNDIPTKLVKYNSVPYNSTKEIKLKWLEGFYDGIGIKNNNTIKFNTHRYEFLIDVKKLINSLGMNCKIEYFYKNIYTLTIYLTNNFALLGFMPKLPYMIYQNTIDETITITKISDNNKYEDTYCFNEPKRHYGVFNGILTGQCAEVIEYSDNNDIAVCNLASICLPQFIKKNNNNELYYDFDKLLEISKLCVRNLNRIIDINFYPVKPAKNTNIKNRPIGIGIQGLADVYNIFGYPFGSDEAKILNKKIHETIYYGALCQSNELAKKSGAYETFYGSPMSEGLLQYHLWGLKNNDLLMGYKWDDLIKSIKTHGTRNSLLTALMPTASTSQIMGNCESFEPYHSNIFIRETLAGEFIIVNKNLMKDLIKEKIWNEEIRKKIIIDNGSIQNIKEIPQKYKDIYKTAFEIKLKDIIDQSADRGVFIDQSQSLNLFMGESDRNKLHSAHFHSWKRGLKTGMYYLRTRPATDPINFGIDVDEINRLKKEMNTETTTTCKWRPGIKLSDCLVCSA